MKLSLYLKRSGSGAIIVLPNKKRLRTGWIGLILWLTEFTKASPKSKKCLKIHCTPPLLCLVVVEKRPVTFVSNDARAHHYGTYPTAYRPCASRQRIKQFRAKVLRLDTALTCWTPCDLILFYHFSCLCWFVFGCLLGAISYQFASLSIYLCLFFHQSIPYFSQVWFRAAVETK